jgi:CheY-like chemotaxis protein
MHEMLLIIIYVIYIVAREVMQLHNGKLSVTPPSLVATLSSSKEQNHVGSNSNNIEIKSCSSFIPGMTYTATIPVAYILNHESSININHTIDKKQHSIVLPSSTHTQINNEKFETQKLPRRFSDALLNMVHKSSKINVLSSNVSDHNNDSDSIQIIDINEYDTLAIEVSEVLTSPKKIDIKNASHSSLHKLKSFILSSENPDNLKFKDIYNNNNNDDIISYVSRKSPGSMKELFPYQRSASVTSETFMPMNDAYIRSLISYSYNKDNASVFSNILVVDDDLLNRKMLCRLLNNQKHTTVTAENGELAVMKMKESINQNIPFSLVLMDYQMPVMDGPTATREMRMLGYKGWLSFIHASIQYCITLLMFCIYVIIYHI